MKPKHVPQRTCIACRTMAGKRGLIRLVRINGCVEIDTTGKRSGRGAYLHPVRACWQTGIESNRIEQALRTKLSVENRQELVEFMQGLPERESIES